MWKGPGQPVGGEIEDGEVCQSSQFGRNVLRQQVHREIQRREPGEAREFGRYAPRQAVADKTQRFQPVHQRQFRRQPPPQVIVRQVDGGHTPFVVGLDAVPVSQRRFAEPVGGLLPVRAARFAV